MKERKTTIKTELIVGMTPFFSMVYILMVNTNMFADPFGNGTNPLGVSYGAIYIATAVGAVYGTSTVTTFSEANAGAPAGGRTGLTAVFCGIAFGWISHIVISLLCGDGGKAQGRLHEKTPGKSAKRFDLL